MKFEQIKAVAVGVGKAVLPVVILAAISQAAQATTTGAEFQPASDRFEGWVGGYYGKAVAIGATGLGIATAAVTKSFIPALGGVGVAVIAPIALGVINATYTAII